MILKNGITFKIYKHSTQGKPAKQQQTRGGANLVVFSKRQKMDSEANEATFEGLMDTETTGFDPNTITHAMITPDGQTVPITLNPETGQFMTPDGQTVQVQMAEEQEEQTFMEQDAETVLPDHGQSTSATEEVDMNIGTTSETSAFQVMETPQESQQQPTVVVKEENFSMIDQSANAGNIQVLSGDGSMVSKNCTVISAPLKKNLISSILSLIWLKPHQRSKWSMKNLTKSA